MYSVGRSPPSAASSLDSSSNRKTIGAGAGAKKTIGSKSPSNSHMELLASPSMPK